MNCARQSFDLMKETRGLPLDLLVKTLILSRRNKLGQLMCVLEEVGNRLSEMIHFEARLVVADPR